MNDASGSRNGAAERAYSDVMGGFPTLVLIDQAFRVQYLERGLDLTALASGIERLLALDHGLGTALVVPRETPSFHGFDLQVDDGRGAGTGRKKG